MTVSYSQTWDFNTPTSLQSTAKTNSCIWDSLKDNISCFHVYDTKHRLVTCLIVWADSTHQYSLSNWQQLLDCSLHCFTAMVVMDNMPLHVYWYTPKLSHAWFNHLLSCSPGLYFHSWFMLQPYDVSICSQSWANVVHWHQALNSSCCCRLTWQMT